MPLAVASIWLEADITHAVAPSCRCAAGVLPFSTRLEPTGGQKRAVPECCMQSAPWKVDRPMMPAGLARMHVHDIVTTDERARQDRQGQGHPRGRKSGRSAGQQPACRRPSSTPHGHAIDQWTVRSGAGVCAVCGEIGKCARGRLNVEKNVCGV